MRLKTGGVLFLDIHVDMDFFYFLLLKEATTNNQRSGWQNITPLGKAVAGMEKKKPQSHRVHPLGIEAFFL